jgi:hypothetical protein
MNKLTWITVLILLVIGSAFLHAQLQTSGGAGAVTVTSGTITANQGTANATPWNQNTAQIAGTATATAAAGIQKVGLADGTGNAVTSTGAALDINIKSGSIGNTAFGLNGGVANVGLFRILPSSCTQSTNFTSPTVGVATGAGTSITAVTTCVTVAFANNITNSAVTLRIADKSGTPIIWVGGGTDYSICANCNVRFPLDGVLFTSGITAIAGTAAAINLQINGVQ